jgi:hypothetical protein
MNESQFYVLCAISLVGILLNVALSINLGGRMDVVASKMAELSSRVAVLENRHAR